MQHVPKTSVLVMLDSPFMSVSVTAVESAVDDLREHLFTERKHHLLAEVGNEVDLFSA